MPLGRKKQYDREDYDGLENINLTEKTGFPRPRQRVM